MRFLVTGTAGFIGFHTANRLLARGDEVWGVDAVTDHFGTELKEARLALLREHSGFREVRQDITNAPLLLETFRSFRPDRVIHLAAQAGVRYSVENPTAFGQSNLVGFLNVLEGCRQFSAGHLVYASTSSVYGANRAMPFRETDGAGHPVSLYAATKRANELMAHSYAHLYGLPTTGLRFFTVYGPWGRPDMAMFSFTRAILEGRPIDVYNNGDMRRDFTYVDDIVEGVVRIADRPAAADPGWDAEARVPAPDRSGVAPFRLYNIGNGVPVPLMEFIRAIEQKLQRAAVINLLPLQKGDVTDTDADTDALAEAVSFRPATPVATGVAHFIDWYRAYYGV